MTDWTETVYGVYVPMQYDLRGDPWRMLVACMLLNRADGRQAKQALFDISDLSEDILLDLSVMSAYTRLESAFSVCGLQHQRAHRVIRFTIDWHRACKRVGSFPSSEDVAKMHGVGQYALDSYKMFVIGEYVDAPADHVLSAFVHSELFARFVRTGDIHEDT
jgi:methyl-CpG-binding domain protein 4